MIDQQKNIFKPFSQIADYKKVNFLEKGLKKKIIFIKLKHVNSDIRSNFFSVRVANQWNRLPSELKEEWTLNRFKMHYDR